MADTVASSSANGLKNGVRQEENIRIGEDPGIPKAIIYGVESKHPDADFPPINIPIQSTTDTNATHPNASSSAPAETSRDVPEPPLSKKAMKRQLKAERFQATKLERRAREKAARKEKKRARKERLENGEQNSEDEEAEERERKRRKVRSQGEAEKFNARVVVDLAFDEMMSEKEVHSLSSQLAYTYAANRRAGHPFSSVLFASLTGKLRARMDSDNGGVYRRWTDCEWWEDGFEYLWSDDAVQKDDLNGQGSDVVVLNQEHGRERAKCAKESIVYLTADSDNVLEELEEGKTYVLGGIVDHNRYKNLCRNKASKLGVQTAQLPIGKFMTHLPTRKVLTVNQTFEILVHWLESRDWEEALSFVMPKRKLVGPDGEIKTAKDGRQGELDSFRHYPHDSSTKEDEDSTPKDLRSSKSDPLEGEVPITKELKGDDEEDVSISHSK